MNKVEQKKYIKDAMQDFWQATRLHTIKRREPPPTIRKMMDQAEALDLKIRKWDDREREHKKKLAAAASKDLRAIKKSFAFGENADTLKLIEAFEKKHMKHVID
ncbi:MAG: hypothetical protein AAF216_13765 [Pseudomonadota bacterium]